MSKINYQELREAAEQATQDEWVAYILPGHNGIYPARTSEGRHCGYFIDWPGIDGQRNAGANARYIAAIPPKVALALLDKIKHLEDTNIDATCRIAEFETNLAALVAENAGLKHAMAVTLEHVSVTDAGQAGVAAMIINDALYHSETPAIRIFRIVRCQRQERASPVNVSALSRMFIANWLTVSTIQRSSVLAPSNYEKELAVFWATLLRHIIINKPRKAVWKGVILRQH